MLSRQYFLNRAVSHAVTMKNPSIYIEKNGAKRCRYRANKHRRDTGRCLIGACILDSAYSASLEGNNAGFLLSTKHNLSELFGDVVEPDVDRVFLNDLQCCHDSVGEEIQYCGLPEGDWNKQMLRNLSIFCTEQTLVWPSWIERPAV